MKRGAQRRHLRQAHDGYQFGGWPVTAVTELIVVVVALVPVAVALVLVTEAVAAVASIVL